MRRGQIKFLEELCGEEIEVLHKNKFGVNASESVADIGFIKRADLDDACFARIKWVSIKKYREYIEQIYWHDLACIIRVIIGETAKHPKKETIYFIGWPQNVRKGDPMRGPNYANQRFWRFIGHVEKDVWYLGDKCMDKIVIQNPSETDALSSIIKIMSKHRTISHLILYVHLERLVEDLRKKGDTAEADQINHTRFTMYSQGVSIYGKSHWTDTITFYPADESTEKPSASSDSHDPVLLTAGQ